MRIRRRNWILKRIVLGFAVAALVAPAAANARLSAGGAGPTETAKIGKGDFVPFATDFPSYAQRSTVTLGTYGVPHVGYNDYLATQGSPNVQTRGIPDSEVISPYRDGSVQTRGIPDSDVVSPYRDGGVNVQTRGIPDSDVVSPYRDGNVTSVSTPQLVASPGFDWSDAGIGAGLALGLVLLGGGAFVATRHLGRPQTA
jgi:hypothetical protein